MSDLPGNEAMRGFLDKLSSGKVSQWIDLPTVAVFGDTSSGKSSLLSNLAMIELPSNHNLTTRCPILLQMRRSDRREARINVQWKSEGFDFEERIATEESWNSIPQFVQEAQEHILHHTGKDVAPDIISLQIMGPGVSAEHPLTLIDLPGLAQSRGQDDAETLVADIQQLLSDYMKNPRCVILAVLPANVDFHNSQIMALAQQVDPGRRRTIPVITKPDLIDAGAERDVLDLLLGHKLQFDISNSDDDNVHDSRSSVSAGFHMIKGRGQAALDRKDSVQDGLEAETKFFQTVEPWKSVEERNLFGTGVLREKLGEIMIQQVKQTVPAVVQEIREKQLAAKSKLEDMGQAHVSTADRRQCYQGMCAIFAVHLKASLSGKGGRSQHSTKNYKHDKKKKPSAAAQLHEACTEFMDLIRSGSLGTIKSVVEGAQVVVASAKGDVRGEVVHLDKSFACVDYIHETDQNIDVLFECRGYKAQQDLEVDEVWTDDGNTIYVARNNSEFDSLRKLPLDLVRTDPSWLTAKIAENRTDDLACFLNVDIFRNIVDGFVEYDWKPHCLTLVGKTRDIMLATVNQSIELMFPASNVRYPLLRRHLEQQCQSVADGLIRETQKQVHTHLETEKHPYTQDHILFDNIAEARNRGLKRELEMALKLDQSKQAVFDTEALQTIVDGVFERNRKKTVEENLAEEMETVLEAYGQVATKRVIDRTPMICWECVRSLTSSVQESLWSVTDETLDGCMQESSGFATTHRALSEELDELNKALLVFESIL